MKRALWISGLVVASMLLVSYVAFPTTYTYAVMELSQTFSALQTFSNGLTVSSGTATINGTTAINSQITSSDTSSSLRVRDIKGSESNQYNLTFNDYIDFMDGIYNGYLTNRWSSGSGWFTADSTGADGDGYTAAVPWAYENGGFLAYAGVKAWQGSPSSTIQTRAASVIDKTFVAPVWCTGFDLPRGLNCTAGSCASPTCAAADSFNAGQMATRSEVFTADNYPGAYLLWKYATAAGIGSTRTANLLSFLQDTGVNQTPAGGNQGDLFVKPMHLYLASLTGLDETANFSTMFGAATGWANYADTAKPGLTLPYVTDQISWNYDQSSAQSNTANFQTLEYFGMQAGAAVYTPAVAAGATANTTSEARLRAMGLRLMGEMALNGYPSAWLTHYGSSRQDYSGYWIGYVLPGLDQVMSNSRIFTLQERRWAKYLFDRALATFQTMDTLNSDPADGMVNPEPFGAATVNQEQDGDKAVHAGHILRAIAWHLILGNDRLEAEQPPNLAWYDWGHKTLEVSTPYYATSLDADLASGSGYGDTSTTYHTNSGFGLGQTTYVPTNERIIEQADEGQVSTTTASSYAWRRIQAGLNIISTGGSNFVFDNDNTASINYGQLRPLMKTDSLVVRGFGIGPTDNSVRPNVPWEPVWNDGQLQAIETIDRSNDGDGANGDYKDVVTWVFHDKFIEEQHSVTNPGGTCATCLAYYVLRPPIAGKAYITQASRIYDSTATIGVRYEVQSHVNANFNARNVTITNPNGHMATDTKGGNGCPTSAEACIAAGNPATVAGVNCCTGAGLGPTCPSVSGGGVATGNPNNGSVRFNTDATVTLTHTIDADMGASAAASNRVKYQVLGKKYSGSPNFLVTLDSGTQRSKVSTGGDTNEFTCNSASEVASDYNAVIYDSSSDDSSVALGAGSHTVAVTNTSGSNIHLEGFQVVSQSPAKFIDANTADGWIPPGNMPDSGAPNNDWYLEFVGPTGTSGYIAWFPDKTLITHGVDSYVSNTSGKTDFSANPPAVAAVKLQGENYGVSDISNAVASITSFTFGVELYPFNGDHHQAHQIWSDIIKWRPRVRAFSGSSATLTISVDEIGIDVTPTTRVQVYGIDTVGTLGVKLDPANDDIIITRSDTGTSGAKIVWSIQH